MLIGTDPYQFEVHDHFCQLPANVKLGYTHGVCVDTSDNVYVFNQSQTAVLIFDRHGMRVATVGPDNKVTLKSVTIGRDLGRVVELASGLSPNDRVIESPPDSIADGDVVRVAAAEPKTAPATVDHAAK